MDFDFFCVLGVAEAHFGSGSEFFDFGQRMSGFAPLDSKDPGPGQRGFFEVALELFVRQSDNLQHKTQGAKVLR